MLWEPFVRELVSALLVRSGEYHAALIEAKASRRSRIGGRTSRAVVIGGGQRIRGNKRAGNGPAIAQRHVNVVRSPRGGSL